MPASHVALALAVALLWGCNFVVMKHIVSELPPLAVSGVRFLCAALPFLAFVPRPVVPTKELIGFSVAFGIVKFGLLFTAFKLGMPSGLASLVLQMQVVFTLLLAILWMGERPSCMQLFGFGLALVGAAVVVAGLGETAAMLPVVLTLAAAFAWAIANLCVKRAGQFDPLAFAVWSSVLPGPVMLAASLVIDGPREVGQAIADMSWTGWAAMAYLAWPVSILSGSLWGFLMSRHPAAVVAPFALLVPVIGFAAGSFVYGEQPTALVMLGGLLIVAGLLATMLATGLSRAR
jgi:O-acetylserine/cysteine efflux transporter